MARKSRLINEDKKQALLESLYDPKYYAPKLTALSMRHDIAVSTVHEQVKRAAKRGTGFLVSNRKAFRVRAGDVPAFSRVMHENGGKVESVSPADDESVTMEVLIDGRR